MNKMKTVIIIPARKGSIRFPNKPMALILGKQLLHRTWLIAQSVKRVDDVYIATDDEGIRAQAIQFGAKVIMTRSECQNGTERVYDAVKQFPSAPEIVMNLQGDAVLTPPWVIQSVVDALQKDPLIQLGTPATQLDWGRYDEFVQSKAGGRVSGTLVVFDLRGNALYFSKGLIPFIRDRNIAKPPIYRHIGLYGYRYETLEKYVKLNPTPLEEMEMLEQLRALENGIPIRVIPVDYQGRTHWSVDNPEDIRIVEGIIRKEGELFQ
jgi:3-deoxy-manno-octulosonate cytidylyltransferase (CMP-KDO synthetase)